MQQSATHLDTGVLAANGRLDESRMTQDQERRAPHQPEHESKRTREPQQRDTDHKQSRIQTLLRDHVLSNLHRLRCEPIDRPEAEHEEEDGEQEQSVVDHSINSEQRYDDGVVARKVACVVSDTLERFVGILWTRDALMVKEFAEWAQR